MEDPILSKGMPLQEQLATELKTKPGQTVKELALALGSTQPVVRTKLNYFKARFISVDGKWECLT